MAIPMGVYGAAAGAVGGFAGNRGKPPRNPADPSLFEDYDIARLDQGPKYNRKGKQINYLNGEDRETQRDYFGKLLGDIDAGLAGQGYLNDDDYNNLLGPGRGNAAAYAAAQRKRANERALATGVGDGSGMLEESMNNIDLAELGANRALYSDLAGKDALMRGARHSQAASSLQGLLTGERDYQERQRELQWQAKVARSQSASMLQDVLGGAAIGFMGGDVGSFTRNRAAEQAAGGTDWGGEQYQIGSNGQWDQDLSPWQTETYAMPQFVYAGAPSSNYYGGIPYIDPATGLVISG